MLRRMLTLPLLLALLLLLPPAANAYSNQYKQSKLWTQQSSAETRANDHALKLTSSLFNTYTNGARNYSLLVLMTATDERIGCEPCRRLDPVYRSVARSYRHRQPEERSLYMGILDYSDGAAVFQQLGFTQAPMLIMIKPTKSSSGNKQAAAEDAASTPDSAAERSPDGSLSYVRYDLSNRADLGDADDLVEPLTTWIQRQTGMREQITVVKPFDYLGLLTRLGTLMGVALFGKWLWPVVIRPLAQSSAVWSSATILFITYMCSGAMYNRIRNTPYAGMRKDGKGVELFAGSGNQYQIETQVMTVLYASLSVCMVFLTKRIPKIQSPSTQRLAVIAGMAIFLVLYSQLIRIFTIKNGGYPFRLLF